MAFLDFRFFSESLGLSCSAYVIVPQKTTRQIGMEGGEKLSRYPTLYLLHGLSDDHTIWMRRTSIERYAAARNIAVVMPAVGRSFYQDMASGPRYWTFVSEELPTLCEHFFPLSTERTDRFAAGLSMGGYGALRLGLGRPDKFAAAASLSGALDIPKRLREAGKVGSRIDKAEWTGIFGSDLKGEGTDSDLNHLQPPQKVATSAGPKPKLFVCCGTEDELIEENRAFRRHLESVHLEATYEESPGQHEWGYWDAQIQRVLDWLPMATKQAPKKNHPTRVSLFTMNLKATLSALVSLVFLPAISHGEPLAVGAAAPEVSAPNQDGQTVNFKDVYAKGPTLVYFYPKADTPGCTKQGCSIRDAWSDLKAKGVQVLGVSEDSAVDQKKFADKYKLPHTLIADKDGVVAKAFQVDMRGTVTMRQSFLIKDGKVVWNMLKGTSTETHAQDVLKALADLK